MASIINVKKMAGERTNKKVTVTNFFRTFYFQSINIKNENWTKYNRDSLTSVVRGNKKPLSFSQGIKWSDN